jgi:precorrin-2 dehydrogenase/sirohydrochlorin ferrochelatase
MTHYPLTLVDPDTHAIVIGGGAVATRKVHGLLDAGARVTVIAPQLDAELEELARAERIAVIRRPYQEGDLHEARLVIAATDDAQVNQAVYTEARARGILVNVVDDPAHCTFHVPAIVRRGDIAIAISTGGASPALAKHLREQIEKLIGDEYAQLAALLAELRPHVQARVSRAHREALWHALIDAVLPLLREGRAEEARVRAENLVTEYAIRSK